MNDPDYAKWQRDCCDHRSGLCIHFVERSDCKVAWCRYRDWKVRLSKCEHPFAEGYWMLPEWCPTYGRVYM